MRQYLRRSNAIIQSTEAVRASRPQKLCIDHSTRDADATYVQLVERKIRRRKRLDRDKVMTKRFLVTISLFSFQ